MTDLAAPQGGASRPDASAEDDNTVDVDTDAELDTTATLDTIVTADASEPELRWAPAPERRKRRWPLALWIGVPALALGAAGWFFGTTLIAPGVTVGGIPVGGLTAAAAQEKITQTVRDTAVEVDLGGAAATFTGADLGATIDAAALAAQAHESHPLWQVGGWFPDPVHAAPQVDPAVAEPALAEALSGAWLHPVDAVIAYDADADRYAVTPGVDGAGIELDTVSDAYLARILDPAAPATLTQEPDTLAPAITTDAATGQADELNAMIATAGFYVGEERTVPLAPDTVGAWLTLTADDDEGRYDISADPDAIEPVVATLAEKVNRPATTAVQIVNNAGTVLRTTVEGLDGRVLGETAGVAAAFATQLAEGDAVFPLDVEVTAHETQSKVRLLEVDLSQQHMWVKEDGVVVDSWVISSGQPGWETRQGRFEVNWKVRMQDMGNDQVGYFQPDVEWVMYFSGDQAFHAVYWRPTTPVPQSHGCVGMPTWRAKWLYEWADQGTDVWIHA